MATPALRRELAAEIFLRKLARKRMDAFVRYLDLGFIPAVHHRLILKELERIEDAFDGNLSIFMPPGSAKSTYSSVIFPAWFIGRNPDKLIICASHTDDLAQSFGRRVRSILQGIEFQRAFPECRLDPTSQAAGNWATTQGGGLYAVGVGGGVTGRRADLVVIDDPIKSRQDADSETIRHRLWEWYNNDLLTRCKPKCPKILIQTRWHADDLAGRLEQDELTGGDKWHRITLPMIAESPDDPLGRKEGERLWADYFTDSMVRQAKRDKRKWAALYQQRPDIDGGNILKAHWWKVWPQDKPLPEIQHTFLSWDTAYSEEGEKTASHSAMTAWGVFWLEQEEEHAVLALRAWNGQIDYPALRRMAKEFDLQVSPDAHLVEKKASGQSLIQDLRRSRIHVRTYNPDRDKITRAYAVQPILEAGRVWIPERKWARKLIAYAAQFPRGAPPTSDYTDTITQALLYLQRGWWIEHPDDAEEDLSAPEPNRKLYGSK